MSAVAEFFRVDARNPDHPGQSQWSEWARWLPQRSQAEAEAEFAREQGYEARVLVETGGDS